ncbi:MAG: hypothetical protein WEB33_07575 [Bacteroidota bacterium]
MKDSTKKILSSCLFAALAFRCVELPPAPVLPTLDIQGSIPLLDRVFTVSDFSSKDTALTTTSDGGLLYEASEWFKPFEIGEIEIQPEAASQQSALGTFQVQTPTINPVSFTYEEISGETPPPVPFIVNADTFFIPQTSIGPLNSFEYIEFDSGTISITIQNTLPVAVEFVEPLTIRNNILSAITDTSLIAALSFSGPISANGGLQTRSSSLAGVTFRPLLRILPVSVSTPGSDTSVTIDAGDGLEIQFSFAGARVRGAKAIIPAQSVLNFEDSTFVVDDSVTLSLALFRSGSFSVELENNIDVNVGVYVRFAELQDRLTGIPFEVSHQFSGTGTLVIPISLSGLKYQSSGTGIGTEATFTVGVSTITNTDSTREVRSTDFVRVGIIPGPPVLVEQVTGRIKPTIMDVNTGAAGFSLGEIAQKVEGNFSFDSLSIALLLSTSSGFVTDYDIRFIGMDRRQNPPKMDSLNVPPPQGSLQRRVFPATSQTTPIVLDHTAGLNAFLGKFFPHLPDTFIIRGTMTLNPADVFDTPQGVQTVYDTSRIYSSAELSFPVRMGITNATVRDSVQIDVREKFPRDIASSTKSGTLYFEIENGLPISIEFRATLIGRVPGGDTDTLLVIPTDGPRFIDAGVADGSGSVVSPTVSKFSMAFSGPEARRFEEAEVLWMELNIQTANNGGIVRIRPTDAVKVRASGNLVYQVNRP